MRDRISALGLFSLLAICAAAAPAQAGGSQFCWDYPGMHYSAGYHWRPFSYGSHLGYGPGYPGLYPPFLSMYPYSSDWSFWYPRPPRRMILVTPAPPVQVRVIGAERRVAPTRTASDAPAVNRPSVDYEGIVERARKFYPQGIPAIEKVWYPDGTVQKIHDGSSRNAEKPDGSGSRE